MMTKEQQRIFEQAVTRGIVNSAKDAYEIGAAELRRQLQHQDDEARAAAQAEAEEIARRQLPLF